MTLCPCGCGQPARTPKGYASRRCALRAIPKAVRVERARRWAKVHPGHYREMGIKSRQLARPQQFDDLLVRWNEMAREVGPSVALKKAYWRGYSAGYQAGELKPRRKVA